MSRPDLSLVVTAHREGRLLYRTLRSARRAVRHAEEAGFGVEVLLLLDRADDATRAQAAGCRPVECDFGDVGPARNEGVRRARGRFVCFLDGDDLVSGEWLARACRAAAASAEPAAFWPEYVVHFGETEEVVRSLGSEDVAHHILAYAGHNFRSAAFCAPRELLLALPFVPCPRDEGFGYEDWHWWCEALAAGVPVRVVPRTCLFVRRKAQGSRQRQDEASRALLPPSRLFDGDVLRRLFAEELRRGGEAGDVEEALARRLAAVRPAPAGWRRTWAAVRRRADRAAQRLMPPLLLERLKRRRLRRHNRRAFDPPDWLLAEWRAAHDLEPLLFPAPAALADVRRVRPEEGSQLLGAAYLDLCGRLPRRCSHVLLVPWLKSGGADLVSLRYARALAEGGLGRGVAVLATEDADSPWARRLPAGVAFVPFGSLYAGLAPEQRRLLLARLLLQRPPQVLQNINSRLGFELLDCHATALRGLMRLYCHVFGGDLSPDGRRVGYGRRYLPGFFDALTAVLSDNRTEPAGLAEQFGFDRDRLLTHYQPVELRPAAPRRPRGDVLEVLWAGRIDRPKRPDLLEAVARLCRPHPFRFHVYGSPLLRDDPAPLPRGRNIVYHGAFDGFGSLPTERFDAFLYTSQWDGLPNILLEAMAAGLPVVASAVGGVPELVQHGRTGLLAEPFDDPRRYADALRDLSEGRVSAAALAGEARALLAQRHSWDAFTQALRDTPGYADGGERQAA